MSTGTLYLVVGPSGAGKDTLIDGARAALANESGFVFARRAITRPSDAGGEDHEALDDDAFAARERAGGFLITWRAHGLAYGLAKSLEDDLSAGRNVIANVSRSVLAELVDRFAAVCIVHITAPPATIGARLAARGREDAADIAGRLTREVPRFPEGALVIAIVNDSDADTGIAKFVDLLRGMT